MAALHIAKTAPPDPNPAAKTHMSALYFPSSRFCIPNIDQSKGFFAEDVRTDPAACSIDVLITGRLRRVTAALDNLCDFIVAVLILDASPCSLDLASLLTSNAPTATLITFIAYNIKESLFGDVPDINIDKALKIVKNRIGWKNLRPSKRC